MPQTMSREMFRLWAPQQRRRYERVDGEPIAMPPERAGHVRAKARIWQALDRAIRDAGLDCEALPDGITVEVDQNTDYEPDTVVNCGPPMDGDLIAATNPMIVVEVLSPSIQSLDVSDKLADYFRVPSIQHFLIIRTRQRQIIHHRRAGETIETRILDSGKHHSRSPRHHDRGGRHLRGVVAQAGRSEKSTAAANPVSVPNASHAPL